MSLLRKRWSLSALLEWWADSSVNLKVLRVVSFLLIKVWDIRHVQ
jgi:hypothetical protein